MGVLNPGTAPKASRSWMARLRGMPGFKRVVTDIPKRSHADVANRHPALQRVVPGAMQQVRDANRGHGPGRFQAGESRRIVNHIVGQQNLLPSTGLEVARGSIVQCPE